MITSYTSVIHLQGPPGYCSGCTVSSSNHHFYIGMPGDERAKYGSSDNPAISCYDLSLDTSIEIIAGTVYSTESNCSNFHKLLYLQTKIIILILMVAVLVMLLMSSAGALKMNGQHA